MRARQPQQLNAKEIVPEVIIPIKYCLYARKNSESEERQVLSIDSQIKEMLQFTERENIRCP